MKKYRTKEKRLTLPAARLDLRETGALLDAALRIDRDIRQRIRESSPSRSLDGQRRRFARIIGRILDPYVLALDRYLLALGRSLAQRRPANVHLLHKSLRRRSPQRREDVPATNADKGLAAYERDVERTRAEWLEAISRIRQVIGEAPFPRPERAGVEPSVALGNYRRAIETFHGAIMRSAGLAGGTSLRDEDSET